ncbi:hypothetical protein DJ87_5441 [Bacillus cereus]|uniref:Uncharacterized protein n=2 Tax=Bacillus cereus TaxID=1396 RepID=A1BYU3_BACCE|nr:hypothetical protein BcAH187_pCER270_0155 [Bacillus cereus]ACJ82705.1 conserved hypothetical protein [Bacillus cereus AH187]KFK72308.1 hypothetical protein DJ87_5441 [Bacillus cereus]
MTAVPGDLLNRNYWITKELVSEIKTHGKNTESTLKQKKLAIVKGILLCINLQVYIKFLKKSR